MLVLLDSAREVISADQAALINDAIRALDLASSNPAAGVPSRESIDAMFADLIDRQPQKPASMPAPDRGLSGGDAK